MPSTSGPATILSGEAKEWLTHIIQAALAAADTPQEGDFVARLLQRIAPGGSANADGDLPALYFGDPLTADGQGRLRVRVTHRPGELTVRIDIGSAGTERLHDPNNPDGTYPEKQDQLLNELSLLPVLNSPSIIVFDGAFHFTTP